MSPGIYLVDHDGKLVEMNEQQYDSEDVLQHLLEDYPNLLAGDQFPGDEPRRWVLVSREAGVASEEGRSARWSVDHVFLDQAGIPTLVEVKRSTDTRIRREVVGQMLDYAANAVVYWPIDGLRRSFEETCGRRGVSADEVLADVLSAGVEPEAFWAIVRTNLQAGRIRMVFVADFIPQELRRIVEFLNEQMGSAEVIAVEIKQYLGEGRRTLVPRVIGQTSAARQAKRAVEPGRQWDEVSLVADLEARKGAASAAAARDVIAWGAEHGFRITYGTGARAGSCYLIVDHNAEWFCPIALWSSGTVETQFQYLKYRPPFDSPAVREELAQRLSGIPGVAIPTDSLEKRPSFPVELLGEPGALEKLLAVLTWFEETVRAS